MLKLQKLIDAINDSRKTRGEHPLEVEASEIVAELTAALIGAGVSKVTERITDRISKKKAPKE